MRTKTILASLTLGLAAVSQAFRASDTAIHHSFNLPGHGIAIEGWSPVSCFAGKAERGSALFAAEHDGVTYHLTDAAQVAEFRKTSDRHVPAFGDWGAFGMPVSDKSPIEPRNCQIVGRPHIEARRLRNAGDERELLRKAEVHWRKVQG